MEFFKKENILCFSKEELSRLFEISKKRELLEEIIKQDVSFNELENNRSKMEKIAGVVGERGAQNRDEHEIFASLFIFLNFYEFNSKVCFKIQGFNLNNNKIATLKDLNRFRQSVGAFDFIIKSKDGFREFELKRYRNALDVQGLFDFIKKKVAHYGNNLGDTNLLIQLQFLPYTTFDLNFHELYKKIKLLNLKFRGEILISYNQNDEEYIMVQIYPKLTKNKIPIQYPSTKLNRTT